MCGIVGIVSKNSIRYTDHIEKMRLSLHHRGPDESGSYFFENCALGHTRLSIVDLGTGQQPMLSQDKNIGVVFNGEIYGYEEIKKRINYPFKTTSDTELLIALYQKLGQGMLEELPGMFSFAIWDEKNQTLFATRDRFGEKPFYYAIGKNGEFIFASEIKAILSTGLISPILDREALFHYFKHLYIHPTQTIYKNIFTLPPAHALTFKNGAIQVEKYWDLPVLDQKITMTEAVDRFKNLFENSLRKQLVADVPVGAFLSGGLDSSTVVAVASKFKDRLKTFSFAFEDSINELPYAREIAQKYNTEHTELYDNDYTIGDLIVEMQSVYDEPFADSSNIPTYLISKLTKKHVTVVLTGDGGDELLGGYGGYGPIMCMPEVNDANHWQKTMIKYAAKVSSKLNLANRKYLHNKFVASKYIEENLSPVDARIKQNSYFTDAEINNLMNEKIKPQEKFGFREEYNSVDDVMRFDIENYMPGDILAKIDRAAMANGLELRAPFLDVDFASFCISLPHHFKINNINDKIILREAYREMWTDSIKKREKQGFGAPVHKWLQDDSVRRLKEKYLDDPSKKIFNIISFENSRPFCQRNNQQTWTLLNFAIWMEKHEFEY